MKRLKCIILAAIVAAMMVPSFAFADTEIDSPTWSEDTVLYFPQQVSKVYNGKLPNILVAQYADGKYSIYQGEKPVTTESADAGVYTVNIGDFSFTYTIKQAGNVVKLNGVEVASEYNLDPITASSVKKKAKKIKIGTITSDTNGKVTYKSMSKKLSVSKSGVITVKKKTKAGEYKVKVTVAGDKNHTSTTFYVIVTVQ